MSVYVERTLYFTESNRNLWHEEDLRDTITRWINDRHHWPPNYGHFEQLITHNKLVVGCNILFGNSGRRWNIKGITGHGNTYGSVRLPDGVIEYEGPVNNISGERIDDFGLQLNPNWECPYLGHGGDGDLIASENDYLPGEEWQRVNHYLGVAGPIYLFTDVFGNDHYTSSIYAEGTYSVRTGLGGETFPDGSMNIDYFQPGDEVMVLQTQNYESGGTVGKFEFKIIESVTDSYTFGDGQNSKVITFTEPLENTYVTTSHTGSWVKNAQIIRIPNFKDVTVPPNINLAAKQWNGYNGGVICFRCSGTLRVEGIIHASGLGFRGGQGGYATSFMQNYYGLDTNLPTCGESAAGFGPITGDAGQVGIWGAGGGGFNTGYCISGLEMAGNGAGAGYVIKAGDGGYAITGSFGHGGINWHRPKHGGYASEPPIDVNWDVDLILLSPGGGGAGGCYNSGYGCYGEIIPDSGGLKNCSGPHGGNGGGVVRIFASKVIIEDGGWFIANGSRPERETTRANGGCTGNAGGGAGGTIWLSCLYLMNNHGENNGGFGCVGHLGGYTSQCYYVNPQTRPGYWHWVPPGGNGTAGMIRLDYNQYFGEIQNKSYYVSEFNHTFNLWELIDVTSNTDRNFMGEASYPVNKYYYATTTNSYRYNISRMQRVDGIYIDKLISYDDEDILDYRVCLSFDDRQTWRRWNGSDWVIVDLRDCHTWMEVDYLNGLSGYEYDNVNALTSKSVFLDVAIAIRTADSSKSPFVLSLTLKGYERDFAIWDIRRPRSFAGVKNKDIRNICET